MNKPITDMQHPKMLLDPYGAWAAKEGVPITEDFGVDLLQVPFLDSSVLGVLLRSARRMRADGGDVVLVSDDPRVLRTIEISGLVSSFRFERTLNEAVDRALTTPQTDD